MSTLDSEYYQPGDVIYRGSSFVKVDHHDLWDKICANCNTKTVLKSCGACKIMKYCGRSCQKKAWPDHKLECPFLPNYKNFRNQTLVQLIGNVILKIKGRDWKTITDRLVDQEVTFDDLMSHTGTKNDTRFLPHFKAVKEDVESYIGKENLPDEKIMFEIFGKVFYNSFTFDPPYDEYKGYDSRAFFIGASKLDHSCVPNSKQVLLGKVLEIRAAKTIHKSEEVTISYAHIITRRDSYIYLKQVQRIFLESCYCSDCSQPFGKSPLTRIIDDSKAVSVLHETDATLQLISFSTQMKRSIDVVTRDKLSQLLQKQEGVLGKTNLRRMQTLAIKALFKDGPDEEVRKDLLELADAMREVWGENFSELIFVYKKLLDINMNLKNLAEVDFYSKKIFQLNSIYFGNSERELLEFEEFVKTLNHFRYLTRL